MTIQYNLKSKIIAHRFMEGELRFWATCLENFRGSLSGVKHPHQSLFNSLHSSTSSFITAILSKPISRHPAAEEVEAIPGQSSGTRTIAGTNPLQTHPSDVNLQAEYLSTRRDAELYKSIY